MYGSQLLPNSTSSEATMQEVKSQCLAYITLTFQGSKLAVREYRTMRNEVA